MSSESASLAARNSAEAHPTRVDEQLLGSSRPGLTANDRPLDPAVALDLPDDYFPSFRAAEISSLGRSARCTATRD